jgi:2-polyprenyl-3-methyl-5-hydroxy-6-metoxy-1,4-benzoquinol methylase
VSEYRFFDPACPPEWTTPAWYAGRARAPHLEESEQRHRMDLAADFIGDAVIDYRVRSLSDMGAGDGGLLWLVRHIPIDAWGYDLQRTNVEGAKERDVKVTKADVVNDQDLRWGELVVVTEVLEHLTCPHCFVAHIPPTSRVVVASTPDGETPEKHYEFHLWGWDMEGFRTMFEDRGWAVVRHETDGQTQVLMGVRA